MLAPGGTRHMKFMVRYCAQSKNFSYIGCHFTYLFNLLLGIYVQRGLCSAIAIHSAQECWLFKRRAIPVLDPLPIFRPRKPVKQHNLQKTEDKYHQRHHENVYKDLILSAPVYSSFRLHSYWPCLRRKLHEAVPRVDYSAPVPSELHWTDVCWQVPEAHGLHRVAQMQAPLWVLLGICPWTKGYVRQVLVRPERKLHPVRMQAGYSPAVAAGRRSWEGSIGS